LPLHCIELQILCNQLVRRIDGPIRTAWLPPQNHRPQHAKVGGISSHLTAGLTRS